MMLFMQSPRGFLEAGLSDFLLPLEHKADEPTVFRAPKIIQGYLTAEELKGIKGR